MPAPKGIDVRQSGGTILVRVGIDDSSGNALATGTAALRVLEWQADGTIKQLDFADNTFKTGTPTTPTIAMTARTLPDATVSGLWSAVLSTANVTNFTVGGIYVVVVTHSALSGVTIRREWQYGAAEGDVLVKPAVTLAAADVSGNLPANAIQWGGTGVTGMPLPTSSYTAPPSSAQLAAAILATPGNLLVTDSTGKVGANNLPSDYQQRGVAVTLPTAVPAGYGGTGATPSQLAAAILATPANKITTDATGAVSMSLTQSIPLSNTPQTIGDALNAARAQGFGKWIFDPSGKTLKLFGPDGATVVRAFTLDNATNPSTRT